MVKKTTYHTIHIFLFIFMFIFISVGIPAQAVSKEFAGDIYAADQKANWLSKDHRFLNKVSALRIPFISNEGQVDKKVSFYAKTFGGTLFVTKKGEIVYALPFARREQKDLTVKTATQQKSNGWVLKEYIEDSLGISPKGTNRAQTQTNYFKGNEKSKWRNDIPSYNEISFGEIYKGISLNLRAHGNNVEKIFTVNPGSRPDDIKLKIKGALALNITKEGELAVKTGLGSVKFSAPIAYQEAIGKRLYVKAAYKVKEDIYGFRIGKYNPKLPLVIDPLLASTFIGGASCDFSLSIALDGLGNVFVAGETSSPDYPTTAGAYSAANDVFVSKLNSDLSSLTASTIIGGSYTDHGHSIAIGGSDYVYITGWTSSSDYPTISGAYNTFNGTIDGFVSKLSNDLSSLLASTFIGGDGSDYGHSIALNDELGIIYVYVSGSTSPGEIVPFPTTSGTYQTSPQGSYDVFISKLDSELSSLVASTLIGGNSDDRSGGGDNFLGDRSIALDLLGNVYVTGHTDSSDYPTTTGVYNESFNGTSGTDVFVSRIDSSLSILGASTFIGGIDYDYGTSIALDESGYVYATGYTFSFDYPTTPGALDTEQGGGPDYADVFVSRLDSDLSILGASTFIGGSHCDRGFCIFLDGSKNIYVTGYTFSSDYPTTSGAYDTDYNGNVDVFVSKLDSNLSSLSNSTFIGGTDEDHGHSIVLDESGNIYVTGETYSTDYPTTSGVYHTAHNAINADVYISKLDVASPVVASTSPTDSAIEVDVSTTITATFSEAMDSATITTDTFLVSDGTNTISGTVTVSDTTATFTPAASLSSNTIYTATITTGAKDLAGNFLQSDHTWSFTTIVSDTTAATAPTVTSTSPADNATGVAVTTTITATFSKIMDSTTITTDTFLVNDGTNNITGTVTYSDKTATFTPAADLSSNMIYSATITTGAKDLAGNFLQSDHTWSFTTNNPPDTPIAITPVDEEVISAEPVTLTASAFSDSDGDAHTRTYWKGRRADGVYDISDSDASFSYEATTGNLEQHTVNGLVSGMKYYWKVRYEDSAGSKSEWSQESSFKLGTSTADNNIQISAGTTVEDFRMISFVQWPDDPLAENILGLASYIEDYRIGTYDPTMDGYLEYGNNLNIKPGRAYWFLARNGLPVTINGVPVSMDHDIDVSLLYHSDTMNGWNMIGCPNKANYKWDDVQVLAYDTSGAIVFGPTAVSVLSDSNDYIDKRLWRWVNGSYISDTTVMEAYEGYWVKVKMANVYLRFPVAAQTNLLNAELQPTSSLAVSDPGDSPPRPMGATGEGGFKEPVGACFIDTVLPGSVNRGTAVILFMLLILAFIKCYSYCSLPRRKEGRNLKLKNKF